MKINKEAVALSGELYRENKKFYETKDPETKEIEDRLISILMKKFRKVLEESSGNNRNGMIFVKIFDDPLGGSEEGYKELEELRFKGIMDILREYNMYLTGVPYTINSSAISHYIVLWDYKAYFESIMSTGTVNKYLSDFDKKNSLVNSMTVYHTLMEDKEERVVDVALDTILQCLEEEIGYYREDNKTRSHEK